MLGLVGSVDEEEFDDEEDEALLDEVLITDSSVH